MNNAILVSFLTVRNGLPECLSWFVWRLTPLLMRRAFSRDRMQRFVERHD
jgi:hypothetical protein